jgi:parallel beta-helix repeat protein
MIGRVTIALAVLTLLSIGAIAQGIRGAGVNGPGPAGVRPAADYDDPSYRCAKNLYVSTIGRDSNDGLTPGTALATVRQAQVLARASAGNGAGYCVRYLPGTYAGSQVITIGGNADTPTGYFALVSDTPGAAVLVPGPEATVNTIDLTFGGNARDPNNAADNYVIVDGFDVQGGAGSGIDAYGHHIKIMNNAVHDSGGGGISLLYNDYWLVFRNKVYDNDRARASHTSGIDLYQARARDGAASFHIVIDSNIAYLNGEGPQIAGNHTDGNGIILDDFDNTQNGATAGVYAQASLVQNNVSFWNGGRGIQLFYSNNITVRNNTAFGNMRDPNNATTLRGDLSNMQGGNNIWVNNIAWADPSLNRHNTAVVDTSFSGFNNPGTSYYNNLTFNGSTGQASLNFVDTNSTFTTRTGNILGSNPNLAKPALSPSIADYHIGPASPASQAGTMAFGISALDAGGAPRVVNGKVDIGAYEGTAPATWMLNDAVFDMDFGDGLAFGDVQSNLISTTRGTVGTDLLPSSAPGYAFLEWAANVARVSPAGGLLIEPSTTNYLSRSLVPATQTTPSLPIGIYTLWVNGPGSATMSAGTAAGCGGGVATQGSPVGPIAISVAGACTITVSGKLNAFQLEPVSPGTSLVVTAGMPATRSEDRVGLTGLALTTIAATPASVMTIGTGSGVPVTNHANVVYLDFANSAFIRGNGTNAVRSIFNGVELQAKLGFGSLSGPVKVAAAWDGSGRSLVANHGAVAGDSSNHGAISTIKVGNTVRGGRPYQGFLTRLSGWNFRLGDRALRELTQ